MNNDIFIGFAEIVIERHHTEIGIGLTSKEVDLAIKAGEIASVQCCSAEGIVNT